MSDNPNSIKSRFAKKPKDAGLSFDDLAASLLNDNMVQSISLTHKEDNTPRPSAPKQPHKLADQGNKRNNTQNNANHNNHSDNDKTPERTAALASKSTEKTKPEKIQPTNLQPPKLTQISQSSQLPSSIDIEPPKASKARFARKPVSIEENFPTVATTAIPIAVAATPVVFTPTIIPKVQHITTKSAVHGDSNLQTPENDMKLIENTSRISENSTIPQNANITENMIKPVDSNPKIKNIAIKQPKEKSKKNITTSTTKVPAVVADPIIDASTTTMTAEIPQQHKLPQKEPKYKQNIKLTPLGTEDKPELITVSSSGNNKRNNNVNTTKSVATINPSNSSEASRNKRKTKAQQESVAESAIEQSIAPPTNKKSHNKQQQQQQLKQPQSQTLSSVPASPTSPTQVSTQSTNLLQAKKTDLKPNKQEKLEKIVESKACIKDSKTKVPVPETLFPKDTGKTDKTDKNTTTVISTAPILAKSPAIVVSTSPPPSSVPVIKVSTAPLNSTGSVVPIYSATTVSKEALIQSQQQVLPLSDELNTDDILSPLATKFPCLTISTSIFNQLFREVAVLTEEAIFPPHIEHKLTKAQQRRIKAGGRPPFCPRHPRALAFRSSDLPLNTGQLKKLRTDWRTRVMEKGLDKELPLELQRLTARMVALDARCDASIRTIDPHTKLGTSPKYCVVNYGTASPEEQEIAQLHVAMCLIWRFISKIVIALELFVDIRNKMKQVHSALKNTNPHAFNTLQTFIQQNMLYTFPIIIRKHKIYKQHDVIEYSVLKDSNFFLPFYEYNQNHFIFLKKQLTVRLEFFKEYYNGATFQALLDNKDNSNANIKSSKKDSKNVNMSSQSSSASSTTTTTAVSAIPAAPVEGITFKINFDSLDPRIKINNDIADVDPRYFGHSTPYKLVLSGLPYFMTISMIHKLFRTTPPKIDHVSTPSPSQPSSSSMDDDDDDVITPKIVYDRVWIKAGKQTDLLGSFFDEPTSAFVVFPTYDALNLFYNTFHNMEYITRLPHTTQLKKYLLTASLPMNSYVPLIPLDEPAANDSMAQRMLKPVSDSVSVSKDQKEKIDHIVSQTHWMTTPHFKGFLQETLNQIRAAQLTTTYSAYAAPQTTTNKFQPVGSAALVRELEQKRKQTELENRQRDQELARLAVGTSANSSAPRNGRNNNNAIKAQAAAELLKRQQEQKLKHDPLKGLSPAFGLGLGAGRTGDISQLSLPIIDQLISPTATRNNIGSGRTKYARK